MVAKLNKPEEMVELGLDGIIIERYEPFEGPNVKGMPQLLSKGRVPISASTVMKRRLGVGNELTDWGNVLIDTSDLIAYDSKGRSDNVKFVLTVDNQGRMTDLGKRALSWINPSAPRVDYLIDLSEGNLYDSLSGEGVIEVSRSQLGEIERRLNSQEVVDSKAWRILARNPDEVPANFAEDRSLLSDHANWVASKTGQTENMGVYLAPQGKKAKLGAWYVAWLGSGSSAGGGRDLVSDFGRFVGEAPEAQLALARGIQTQYLDSKTQTALDAGIGFAYKGHIYVPTSAANVEVKE